MNNKKGFVIYSPNIAAQLLQKKCTMIKVRPDEKCPTKTVFIFKVNENLVKALKELNIHI